MTMRQEEHSGFLATCDNEHWTETKYEDGPMATWLPGVDGYEMHLRRVQFTGISTIGELWLGDWMECYTLEDCVRPVKIPKVTAIPAGRYQVVVDESTRFKRLMPLLLKVPAFEGVRMHNGNYAGDTEGCILTGRTRGVDFIGESVLAFNQFYAELQRALARDKVWIRITNEHPTAGEPA